MANRLRDSRPSTLEVLFACLEMRCQEGMAALQKALTRKAKVKSIQLRTVALPTARVSPLKTLSSKHRKEILGDAVNLFKHPKEEDITPLRDQLANWMEKTAFSNSTFITAIIYIDRLTAWWPEFRLTKQNISRVFAASLVIAAKSLDEKSRSMSTMARVAGVSEEKLCDLEAKLLELIVYQCTTSPRDLRSAEMAFINEAIYSPRDRSAVTALVEGGVLPRIPKLLRVIETGSWK